MSGFANFLKPSEADETAFPLSHSATATLASAQDTEDLDGLEPKDAGLTTPLIPLPPPVAAAASDDRQDDFVVSFTGDDDPCSPKSISTARKWLIVTVVSSTSLCVACTSSLFMGTYAQIKKEFHVAKIVTTLGLSIFVVGLGLSPMVLMSLSEYYSRKPIYVISRYFEFGGRQS